MILKLSYVLGGQHSDGALGGFNVAAELEKLKQVQYSNSHLEIGDLLRVRGPVTTSKHQREIMASTYCESSHYSSHFSFLFYTTF